MPTRAEAESTLKRWLPDGAVSRVCDYLMANNVSLRIARERTSKLGDYRPPQRGAANHAISVDGSLGREFFLFVLLHEMAHLENRRDNPRSASHGHEWQAQYARLIVDYLDCFPPDLQPMLAKYASRIPLNRRLLAEIEAHMKAMTPGHEAGLTLADLQAGDLFSLRRRPGTLYRADERRRTRWLCTSLSDGRRYLVSGRAEVEPAPKTPTH